MLELLDLSEPWIRGGAVVHMSSEMTATRPLSFAGLALPRWFFGMRVWVTMMLALYAAFWLQIDGASSAAVTVAILALPTRGQALEKALYRFGATLVGVTASIAISGLFSQQRDLFVLAYAGWLGLCVFVANLLDGNRAYGAVLSGYTVAIVSVMKVDSPQDVFMTGMNRGAAIAIGIATVALVNDLFAAPNVFPKALAGVSDARQEVLDLVRNGLRDGTLDIAQTADTFKALTALHPTISALAAESRTGAAAARSTVAALVDEIMAARAAGLGEAARAETAQERSRAAVTDADGVEAVESRALAERDRRATQGLADMKAGRRPAQPPGLPLFRSRRLAARKAFRVGAAVALSSLFFIYSSWPQTSIAFTFLGAVAALSSTMPNPKGFSILACLGIPLAALTVGITEFLVLDGVDQYPLLCIALAPPVVGACLLQSSSNQKLAVIGFLVLVFVPVLLSPSNPQNYNPQSYLTVSMLATTGVLALAFWLTLLTPASDAQQRRWLLRSAKADLSATLRGRRDRLTPSEAAYRSADRIGQLAAVGAGDDPARAEALADAFAIADLDHAVRRVRYALVRLAPGSMDGKASADVQDALAGMDVAALRAAADSLPTRSDSRADDAVRQAGRALMLVADLAAAHRPALQRLMPGLVAA